MVHTTCQHACSNGCVATCMLFTATCWYVGMVVQNVSMHVVWNLTALILCVDFISRYFHPVISAFDIFSKKCTHVYRHIHELNIYVKCLCIQNVPALVCVCTFQVCMVFSTFPLCHAEWPLSVLTWHITELRLELMCVYNTSADNMHTSKHENMPDTVHTEREREEDKLWLECSKLFWPCVQIMSGVLCHVVVFLLLYLWMLECGTVLQQRYTLLTLCVLVTVVLLLCNLVLQPCLHMCVASAKIVLLLRIGCFVSAY